MSFMSVVGGFIGSMGWYVIPFIVVLSVVVFFHELGHYLVGRWCGVKIERFSLGFGPELFAWVDKRGTRWRLADSQIVLSRSTDDGWCCGRERCCCRTAGLCRKDHIFVP